MKRAVFLSLVSLVATISSHAQILKGKVTNESGEAIQYATVYIQELKQGTTANTKGDYEIKLPAGKYLVTYQSLGYSPVFYDITIPGQTITRNVILPVQYYEIPEVRITATGEDPAYGIMRKVIGMAPYYLNYISYYKADVYLKGNLVFNKIPKIMQRAMISHQWTLLMQAFISLSLQTWLYHRFLHRLSRIINSNTLAQHRRETT